MKRYVFIFVALLVFQITGYSQAWILPDLQEKIDEIGNRQEFIRAVVILNDQVDVQSLSDQLYRENASPQERSFRVITALQEKADATQGDLRAYLKSQSTDAVREFESYWVINMFLVEAVPDVLIEISQRNDVAYMDYEHETILPRPIDEGPAPESPNSAEPGLKIVNADKMWQMGYTGAGIIVMTRDSGVNGSHPALSARWRGNHVPYNHAWLGAGTFPTDTDGHGTHTMGTITGLDPATNDTIGMAPGAEWIAASFSASVFSAFQWAMNPDGNPSTTDDMPVVISNSWGFLNSTGLCYAATYASLFNSVEAAGIAIVFSAGNEGSGSQTITAPKNINTNLVNSWATGAINGAIPTLPIAGFSSRGPSGCGGSGPFLIKPEAVAPGVNVRSSYLGTGYQSLSGTSMSCPHVAGAIALLKEAFPNKTGEELKLALYFTARETEADLTGYDDGEPSGYTSGEDHNYGRGLIDVFAAYNFLLQGGGILPNSPENFVAYSDYQTPNSMELSWDDPTTYYTGDPMPPADFRIMIERDSVLVDSVPGGTGQYTDAGLVDGQEYNYAIYAKVDGTSLLSDARYASWIAGGSPIPNPPVDATVRGDVNQVTLRWVNPARNIDNTPMDDLAGVNLYRNGALETTFSRSPSDTGRADSATYSPSTPGYYSWQLSVVDNENPPNESELTDSLLTPLSITLTDAFHSPGSPLSHFWFNVDADVNDRSLNPPSGPYALNLNGTPSGGDMVELRPVDLSSHAGSGVVFSYQYQPEGQGDPLEPDDSLRVLFRNHLGDWVLVRSYGGAGVTPFQMETIDIATAPNGGGSYFHSQFQVRLEARVSPHPVLPRDDWFVDNIYLGIPHSAIAASADTLVFDSAAVGATDTLVLEVQNIGLQPLQVTNILSSNPAFAVNRTNFAVSAGTYEPVHVTYTPPGGGHHSGMLHILSDAPNADTLIVYLEGSVVTGIEHVTELPKQFALSQNYPNPFNPSTIIKYQLPQTSDVVLEVYNILGQKVRSLVNGRIEAGYHEVVWDARDDNGAAVGSGIYFCRFEAGGKFASTQKMILLK